MPGGCENLASSKRTGYASSLSAADPCAYSRPSVSGRGPLTLAGDLGVAFERIYRWLRQERIALGLIPGMDSVLALGPADARRRIRELEDEHSRTSLAASVEHEEIPPEDGSRSLRS